MRKTIRKIGSCMVVLALLCATLTYLTTLMERKASIFKYRPFFEEENNFDVLFMGTSHVINAVFPMELWKDYGITSYNFGGHANQLAVTYWVLQNALDYTNPQVVMIDCLSLASNVKTANTYSYVHLSLDAFPFSKTKVCAVRDLLDDPEVARQKEEGILKDNGEMRTPIGMLWDFSVYHARWKELREEDFAGESSREKGAESRIAVAVPQEVPAVSKDQRLAGETTGTRYLRRMIEECRAAGIEVLLTYLPFPASEGQQIEANTMAEIAREYDVNYLNFLGSI